MTAVCPMCSHDAHDGTRCTARTWCASCGDNAHACACSWSDPGNFATTNEPRHFIGARRRWATFVQALKEAVS